MASSTFDHGSVPLSSAAGARSETGWRSNRPGSLGFAILGFVRGLADGWHAFRRWQALDAMSDRQLKHIGMERGDIARAAVFGPATVKTR